MYFLVFSLITIVSIICFFSLQFKSKFFLEEYGNKLNLNNLDQKNNTKCKVIFKTEKLLCENCGGKSYSIREVENGHVLSVNGQILTPGKYCVRDDIPLCDSFKGILVIDADETFECICRYPEYFNGPNCATQVACRSIVGLGKLVDEEDNEITENVDYYKTKAKCKCNNLHTGSGLRMTELGRTECIIDPCLYPLPFPEKDAIGFKNNQCNCGKIIKNIISDDLRSPCSSCTYDYKDYEAKIPIKCYNQNQLVQSLTNLYPCVSLRDDNSCGETKVYIKQGDDYLEGAINNLYKIAVLT